MPAPPGLLTGHSGSSPPRAAGRLQRRPGHDSRPRPPAGARGLAAVRGLRGSASGARALGARAQGTECGPSAPSQGTGMARVARARPGVPAAFAWGSLREGRDREQRGAPWRLGGTPEGAGCRVARAFPGLGARDSASPAVTAGDVSASQRAEGTSVGAGFWASLELCPLSLRKKPNQKANLQASKPDVTLSAGRQPHRMTSRAYLASRTEGRLVQRFVAGQGHWARSSHAGSPGISKGDTSPTRRPPTQSLSPGAWSFATGSSCEKAKRPDLDSPELEASRRELSTSFPPCPQETPPEIPKLSPLQTHLWFLNIAGDDYPGRVHPSLGEDLRGWRLAGGALLFFSSCLPFTPHPPHPTLGAELSLSFSHPKSNNSFVRDALGFVQQPLSCDQ
ncbi:uncharacterized protein LOC128111146 isoform X2 [Peromyscus californicus insignis]|uniref:uncharacterized protein LOC128111146 isoform X2 n=1 Tax=Peromyscus californicus insignis TaxID=564181 RepID=UPI0022A68CC6|nr:uncharacterized protein LOC128111146 isoform X2 [Peromyscus californicus insignis]